MASKERQRSVSSSKSREISSKGSHSITTALFKSTERCQVILRVLLLRVRLWLHTDSSITLSAGGQELGEGKKKGSVLSGERVQDSL